MSARGFTEAEMQQRLRNNCAYHQDDPATHRATWTVYGGALEHRQLCDKCSARMRGQRGVALTKLDADVPASELTAEQRRQTIWGRH